ncbi:subtype I-C CRISPR-associated endonuclease Cas1 [Tyzzerella sp. An114]|uniref:type I-C CRISPR-associated endonuclease Cas1c n=1 Tax=Tyzzerella sp. An114 TaxID=1965545 RepID=UPI000B4369C8|nr:type I-C CRISPR-associated endonuclease Cas1c [Tyzzerella sp. An114]OUQ55389.1 subtype I-C CRISPR-associated endonuclease Cas1 [Tyzzerella sp. An114]
MRRLLNTVYVTNEMSYLYLDGENIVCKVDDEIRLRIPFENVENIVCFNYMGCSPALMGKCVEKCIPINFVSPQGKFLAKVCGETKGNVFLRVQQIDKFRENGLFLSKNTMAAKFSNTRQVIKRTLHDNTELRDDNELQYVMDTLLSKTNDVFNAETLEEVIGIEGNCAKLYFSIFDKLITNKNFKFECRSKRPPLDPINAMLSFIYTLATNEFASSLETVGLDSYIGFCHSLRSGRNSLACDLVEEFRCMIERFVITLVNLKIITYKDFETQISGAVWLNDEGRKKVLTRWQEKKRTDIVHPYLKQKIPFGLIPYVQSNLLAKYVRGDIDEYPCFLVK